MGHRRRITILPVLFLLAFVATVPGVRADHRGDEATLRDRTAMLLWQKGYALHLLGAYDAAIAQFRESIRAQPSAEGHTFLGWSLSHKGRYREAIAECKKAIPLDPEFGNPYNDIGVYLTELGRPDEAVPWLKRAIRARRYCCYQFAHFNLGRILLAQGDVDGAERAFRRALEFAPDYGPARAALKVIRELAPKL